jgi:transcriptional regulator with XRE-family HTH domain
MKQDTCSRDVDRRTLVTAQPFGVALGHRLRRVREDAGLTGDQLATLARTFGLAWDRSTLTKVELGQRQVSAAEFLLLPLLFERPLADLLPTEPVRLTDGAAVGADALRRGLTQRYRVRDWSLPGLDRLVDRLDALRPQTRALFAEKQKQYPNVPPIVVGEAAIDGWLDQTTTKAATRLGVSREDVAVAARQLWARGVAAERDARLARTGKPETTRQRQARRGHITRHLLDELRPVVADIQNARTGKVDK